MADLSTITLPNGNTYNLKDATARSNSGVTGVKGNAESSYRTGNVNLTAANIGAVATSGNETVAGNKTFSGVTTLSTTSTYPATAGTIIPANATTIIQSPIPKYLWHDIFAFCRVKTPTYYTTTNGTTWTESTLNKNLFAHKEAWSGAYILRQSESLIGSRWTWINAGFYASMASWLVLGIAYTNPVSYFDLTLETSSDSGSTWTTLVSVEKIYYSQTPIWIKLNGTMQGSLRLTIVNNNASANNASLNIVSIRCLTHRWGNQGQGSQYEHPYIWDENFNLSPLTGASFVGNLTGNASSATNASKVNNHTVNSDVPANAKFTDTTYSASTISIGSASTGTAISADDITAWTTNTPTVVSPATVVTGGSTTSITPVSSKNVVIGGSTTEYKPVSTISTSSGTAASASVSNGVLTITNGSTPITSVTASTTSIKPYTSLSTGTSITTGTAVTVYKSLTTGPAATVTAGTAASLSYTSRSIPNISVTSKNVVSSITTN